jgi:hypothetical protein
MLPYQERVVAEKEELDKKLSKLIEFLVGDLATTLNPDERTRLERQHDVMQKYSEILDERIKAF